MKLNNPNTRVYKKIIIYRFYLVIVYKRGGLIEGNAEY